MEQLLSQSAMLGNIESTTPGKLCHLRTYEWADNTYQYDHKTYQGWYEYKLKYNRLNENDTYITILNMADSHYVHENTDTHGSNIYKLMKKDPHFKIIWESEMAVNRRPGHGTKPRNKMVIFEYVKDPE